MTAHDRQLRDASRNSCSIAYSANSESSKSTSARRLEARDLAAQLGADRAAGAGDQHRLAVEEAVQAGVVEHHRIAPEQVVELDRPQRARRCTLPGDDVGRAPAPSSPSMPAAVHSSTARLRSPCVAPGIAMIACVTPMALGDLARPASMRPEHLHADQLGAALRRIVVEQADHAPVRGCARAPSAACAPAAPAPSTSTGSACGLATSGRGGLRATRDRRSGCRPSRAPGAAAR